MAKHRVSALAKELGTTSAYLIRWLNDHGEYVKTPSSTLETPVVVNVSAQFEAEKAAPPDGDVAARPEDVDPPPEIVELEAALAQSSELAASLPLDSVEDAA